MNSENARGPGLERRGDWLMSWENGNAIYSAHVFLLSRQVLVGTEPPSKPAKTSLSAKDTRELSTSYFS